MKTCDTYSSGGVVASRAGRWHRRRAFAAVAAGLALGAAAAMATMAPDRVDLKRFKQDGSFERRRAYVNRFSNHEVTPALVRRVAGRLARDAGGAATDPDAQPPGHVHMPTKGLNRIACFLFDFSDEPHVHTQAEIADKIFGDGDASQFPYESVREYYLRSSYNQLDIQGDVHGWYRMAHPRTWYTNTYGRENGVAYREIVREVVEHFDATVDFTRYDNDANGTVDYAAFIWAGPYEEWGDFWWAYQMGIAPLSVDGKTIRAISWQSEGDNGAQPFSSRVVIHETGHALGLPDYYDYDESAPRGGVGGLDMMDANWGDHCAFSKYMLEWLTPEVLRADVCDYPLEPISEQPRALILTKDHSTAAPFTEFFIVENAYRSMNNTGLPSNGLLIWHVDASLDDENWWFRNNNSYTRRKLLRLMEADGLEEIERLAEWADAGDFYTAGDRFSPWTVPNSDTYGGGYSGISVADIVQDGKNVRATFRVGNGLKVENPWNVSDWKLGRQYTIRWNPPTGTVNVRIELSRDGGSSWTTLRASQSAATKSWAWTVPSAPAYLSDRAVIRISDTANLHVTGVSQTFKITADGPAALAVHMPDGTNRWNIGETRTVRWIAPTWVTSVQLQYSPNDGATWQIAGFPPSLPAADGEYVWTIPSSTYLVSAQARVRVIQSGTPANRAVSERFIMGAPDDALTILAPAGGETWLEGETYDIRWRAPAGMDRVTIMLSDHGSPYSQVGLVADHPAAAGRFAWTVPDENWVYADPTYLQVYGTINGLRVRCTSEFFGIVRMEPRIALDSPCTGDVWKLGQPRIIRWNAPVDTTALRLHVSPDDGANYYRANLPTTVSAAQGWYEWTLPTNTLFVSENCRIMAVDDDRPEARVAVSERFTIRDDPPKGVELLEPGMGVVWAQTRTHRIRWVAQPGTTSLQLQYSWNGGQSFSTAPFSGNYNVPATPAYFDWTPPDSATHACTNAYLKIVDRNNATTVYDIAGPFVLRRPGPASLEVVAPAANDVWEIGRTYTIRWNAPAGVERVQLQYSWDPASGFTISTFPDVLPAWPGEYTWTIPDNPYYPGTEARVRVIDYDLGGNRGDSGYFTVKKREPTPVVIRDIAGDPTSGSFRLRWDAEPDETYRVLFATNVGGAVSFAPFSPNIPGAAPHNVYTTAPPGRASGLFRVERLGR